MTIDIATIGVEFDTSSVKAGNAALDATTVSGNRAADSLDAMGTRGSASMYSLAGAANLLKASLAGISFAATVRELYSADVALNSIKSTLSVALGPQAAAGMEYVRAEAQRLGLGLQSTAQSFAEFEAASIGTALQGKKAADVFDSVAEAATALHLPVQQTNSLFLALQQMLSKGTVQAQELHLQFGQAIPGAMGLAARSMGVTTAELNKMIASGTVLSTDFLPKLATELHNTFGGAAAAASDNLLANTNRLETAFTNLKQGVNAAGMSQTLNEAARSLTELVNLANSNIGPILDVSKAVGAIFVARSAAPIIVQLVATTQAIALQAQSTIKSAEAEAIYQAALVRTAETALAKARAVEVAAAAEVASLTALVDATAAEARLEASRINAQISEQGRTASLLRMTEASVAAAGATELLAVAERSLAAAQGGVAAASAVATVTTTTATAAVAAAGLTARAAAAGLGVLRGAMGLLGGPVGVAITGLSLLYMWTQKSGDQSERSGGKITKSFHEMAEEMRRVQSGGPIISEEQTAQIAVEQKKLEAYNSVLGTLQAQRDGFLAKGDTSTADQFAKSIQNVQGEIKTLTLDIATMKGEQAGMFDPTVINEATKKLRENNAEYQLAISLARQGTSPKNALGDAKLLISGVSPADIKDNNEYKKTLEDITKAQDAATQAVKRHADEVRGANESSAKKLAAYETENALIAQGIPLEEARMRGDLASKGVTESIIAALVRKDAIQRALIQHADDTKTISTLNTENDLILKGVDALTAKARAAVIAANAPQGKAAIESALADLEAVQSANKHTDALTRVSDAANAAQRAQAEYALTVGAASELQAAGVITQQQYTQAIYDAETARAQASGTYAEQALQIERVNTLVAQGISLEDAQAAVSLRSAGANQVQVDQLKKLKDAQDQISGANLAAPFQTLQETLNQLSTTWGRASANIVTGFSVIAQANIKAGAIYKDIAEKGGQATQDQIEQLSGLKAKTLGGYGSMAAGAQTFFKQGSSGYKALGAVSEVFYAAELALNLEAIAAKLLGITAVTTATVVGDGIKAASDTTYTAGSIALSLARTGVKAVEAAVSAMAGLPFPANIAALAATVGVLAAIGVKIGGGGGGGGGLSAQQQQDQQGTGTVLGDRTAKSESISKGIEVLGKLDTAALSYSQRMLAQLTSINEGINGLGALLIQTNLATGGATPFGGGLGQSGIGGVLNGSIGRFISTSPLEQISTMIGNLIGGPIGSILGAPGALLNKLMGGIGTALFGGKQSLRDTGIDIGGTVDDLSARYYGTVHTSGGLLGSSSNHTSYAALDAQTTDQINKIIDGLGKAVIAGVGALGGDVDQAEALLKKMTLDIGHISLKGLSGEEVQKQLAAVFSALGDRMVATVGETLASINLQKFQQVGEGLLETLARVASNFEYAKEAAERLGVTLVPLTNDFAANADVASALIKASIVAAETTSGVVSGLGQLAAGFNGTADDLLSYVKSLYLVRTSLREVGINANALTATLVNAADGIDNLQSSLNTYQDAFFSDSEKAAAKTVSLTDAFAKLGFALPDSYGQFRALVDSIDTSTNAGQKLLGNVLSLASGFDDLQQSLDAANQAQQQLQNTLDQAVNSNDLPEKKLSDLMAQFDNAYGLALASSGVDLQKQAGIINDLIGPLVDEIKAVYASGAQSTDMQGYVSAAVEAIIGKLGGQSTANAPASSSTLAGAAAQSASQSPAPSASGVAPPAAASQVADAQGVIVTNFDALVKAQRWDDVVAALTQTSTSLTSIDGRLSSVGQVSTPAPSTIKTGLFSGFSFAPASQSSSASNAQAQAQIAQLSETVEQLKALVALEQSAHQQTIAILKSMDERLAGMESAARLEASS